MSEARVDLGLVLADPDDLRRGETWQDGVAGELEDALDADKSGYLFCQNVADSQQIDADWERVKAVRVFEGRPFSLRAARHHYGHIGTEGIELGTAPIAPDAPLSDPLDVQRPKADTTPIAFVEEMRSALAAKQYDRYVVLDLDGDPDLLFAGVHEVLARAMHEEYVRDLEEQGFISITLSRAGEIAVDARDRRVAVAKINQYTMTAEQKGLPILIEQLEQAEFIRVNGRWLVDGALVDPVPVGVAKAMAADVVIAVDLNSGLISRREVRKQAQMAEKKEAQEPEYKYELLKKLSDYYENAEASFKTKINDLFHKEEEIPDIIDTVMTSINIMQERITRINLAVEPPDILVQPRLGELKMMDFDQVDHAIEEGYLGVMERIDDIKALLVSA